MFSTGFIVGKVITNNETSLEISYLENNNDNNDYLNNNVYYNNSIIEIYTNVKESIVEITGIVTYQSFFGLQYSQVQGSGFIYDYDGIMIIITNNHVVSDISNIIVTFENGNSYPAEIIGSDPYSDLAILTLNASINEYKPLNIVSSNYLRVGDPVIAIGNPLGLESTMTTGIISQIGRTIKESLAGDFPIANILQSSAAINPGNSGGPLLNYNGEVIGITTAIIENSEGLGFAIPSNTILKELDSLVNTGVYNKHSWLGISGVDMTYYISEKIGVNVTYGWLITQVIPNSPADNAGLIGGNQQIQIIDKLIQIGGDIIISINGNRVINGDYLMSYLEENTLPDQIVNIKAIRDNQVIDLSVKLESRPV
jgi:S1-C subfamily serine protease